MELIFVYGTLKSHLPNHHLLKDECNGKAKFISVGTTIEKWPLIIASKYNIPYLMYKRGVGNYIKGEIYEVDNVMMYYLDKFEGVPAHYERIIIEVRTSTDGAKDKILKCWAYVRKNSDDKNICEKEFIADYSNASPKKYIPHSEDFNIDFP